MGLWLTINLEDFDSVGDKAAGIRVGKGSKTKFSHLVVHIICCFD